MVAEEQLGQIQEDIKTLKRTNQDLEKRVKLMDSEYAELQKKLDRTKKDTETRLLEAKLEALEESVAYLRKERGELEEKAAKFR